MFTHKQIWQGLDRLAASKGYSPSGLARRSGLDPTSFNKSKRISPDGKPRWPSTESLTKVLIRTDSTLSDFTALLDPTPEQALTAERRKEIARETAEALIKTESVLCDAKNPFILKSGRKSPVYIDCRRLISFVDERTSLMSHAARVLDSSIGRGKIDALAGGETAGIPYAAYISDRMNRPMVYVRKQAKGHGRMAQIEGHLPEDKPNVVLVEDLQTDGGSKKIFIDALRATGARVDHVFVLFRYGIFDEPDLGVKTHALATWWDVLAVAREKKYFRAKTLDAVEAFLNNPHGWDG